MWVSLSYICMADTTTGKPCPLLIFHLLPSSHFNTKTYQWYHTHISGRLPALSPCRMRSSRCSNIIYSMQVNYSSCKCTLMSHRSQNMWSCLQMIYTSHMHAWMHLPLPCGMNMASWPTVASSRAVVKLWQCSKVSLAVVPHICLCHIPMQPTTPTTNVH